MLLPMPHRPIRRFLVARVLAAGFLATGLLAAPALMAPATAQSDLSREVEILKRDLKDLQRYIYRGEGTPPAPSGQTSDLSSGAQNGGQASSQSTAEPMPNDVAGRLQIKIQRLEREMRGLTGRVEEAEFRIRQAADRMEKLASDIDFRLQQLEQGRGPTASTQGTGQGQGTGQSAGAPQALGQVGANRQEAGSDGGQSSGQGEEGTTVISSTGSTQDTGRNTGQGGDQGGGQTLGSLRTNADGEVVGAEVNENRESREAAASSAARQGAGESGAAQPQADAAPGPGSVSGAEATASAPAGALPDGSAAEQYEYAFSLLRKRDFAAAETAMRSFVDKHGDDALAGNAMYWLGETYYARGNYRDAAATFLDAYTGYPQNDKASHSLLKLAMSLGALGKTDAACQAFSTLRQEGNAGQRILDTADAEAAKLGCG